MNEEKLKRIRASITRLRERMDVFAPVFFGELHLLLPEVDRLFPSEEVRRTKLGAMLSTLANARDLEKIAPVLTRLGGRHGEYGVAPAHYRPLVQALTVAAAKADPEGFAEGLQSDWPALLQEFIQRMQPSAPVVAGADAAAGKTHEQVQDASLYAEVGGYEVVERVHTRFYKTLFDDDWLGGFFLTKSMQSLILKQTRFMVAAFGGPDEYHWESPAMAHMHMMVSAEQADIRETLLRNAIRQEGLSQAVEDRWLRVDQAFRPAIVKQDESECVLRCPGQMPVVVQRPVNYRMPVLVARPVSSPVPA